MEELTFLVQGSASKPYEVIFIKDGSSLSAICSCPAGQNGNYCKHRIAILDGDTSAIVSDNAREGAKIPAWLPGTDVEAAMTELRALEKDASSDRKIIAAAKKKLARAMNS